MWVVRLLNDLGLLEHLELRGRCGYALRCLRRVFMRRVPSIDIQTLAVHSIFGYEIRQALRLKDAVDGLGLGINVTSIREPSVRGDEPWDAEEDGASQSWD